jgi:ATP-dependent Lon protease
MSTREKMPTKYNLRNKKYRKKNPPPPSSDSSDDMYDSEEDTVYSTASDASDTDSPASESRDPEAPKKFNRKNFQHMLTKMFPSKYINNKTKASNEIVDVKSQNVKEHVVSKKDSEKTAKVQRKKTKERNRDNSDTDNGNKKNDSELYEQDEESDSSSPESPTDKKKGNKYSIVLTIGENGKRKSGDGSDEDYDDDYEDFSDDDSYEESDDEEQCNSADEAAFMKETYEKIPDVPASLPVSETKTINAPTKSQEEPEDTIPEIPEDIESEYLELNDIKKRLSKELEKRPNNKILKKSVQECTDSIRDLIKRARRDNTRKYRKLVYDDTKQTNEIEYFKRKLSNKEQQKVMDDLYEIYTHIYTEKPYRLSLIQSNMSSKFKAIAMQKLNVLKMMDPSNSEYYKIKNWVDTFMKIPFGIYKNVSVSISDGTEKCNQFLVNAKQTLDNCTYGLNDAKMQIMQILGQWMVNPVSVGSAIAIHGPMGTGKTTLVKDGISKILGREFTFIALGGSGDAGFLEGHSYTYEGSMWGKIVQILIDSKCMNPVIYFDELDKVSDSPRGQEIIGILTHLIDTSQNTQFHDKYFSEIDFDLSKCLFIFSYNDENLVNPILKDRMYHIRTKGYETKDKVAIARNYLLPKIRELVCFSEADVVIPDEMIQYIITSFTKNEMGVRNLKRCLEIIYSKLNLFRLVAEDNKMFVKDMNLSISFPIIITKKEIDVFVKPDDSINQSMMAMYV